MKTLGALAAAGAITVLPLAGAPAATAESAAALGCPRPMVANLDPGSGVMKGAFNLKVGPYAGTKCPIVRKVAKGAVLYFHCWVENSRGTLWVYARVKGTAQYGWMSIDNLTGFKNATFQACPPRRR
ncbi:hypothetical protein [Nonomuraea basaltis]|uniref:hypothetical protein n=1 Tax=Nonomuraea basaltis TaxID=2495887 RepID=UPI00110C53A5|nr:hypothetical protein [Nonomuraea basaltis]TMR89720.1 hypothetical protein EJK15_59340 [Nonomuraea basaltis]